MITLAYRDVKKEVKFSRKDEPATIESAICRSLRIRLSGAIILTNTMGHDVAISGNLSPGEYSVSLAFVSPQPAQVS